MLNKDALITTVLGLVISHLDYASSILVDLPKCDINKLQRVQNMASKLVLGKAKYDSATECLKQLYWLPIKMRIKFRLLCLIYKTLNNILRICL